MTINEQFAAADAYTLLWKAMMPDLKPPDRAQFLVWTGTYSTELVSRGINRAGAKVRKLRNTPTPMTGADAERYAGSVMRNESLGIRRHEKGKA